MSFTPKTTKERVLHRMKIIQGHLKTISQMVENDAYCIDVIHQSKAVQKALRQVDGLILENHLKTCVAHSIQNGKSEEAVAEVMQVLDKTI